MLIVIRPEPVCDFCSDTPVFSTFTCQPHTTHVAGITAEDCDGAWAACKTCDELIRKEDWEGLLEHSLNRFRAMYGTELPQAREFIAQSHAKFRELRTMEA